MSHPGKARALLATLRIANAPSVVSNVFLGYMLGSGLLRLRPDIHGLDFEAPVLIATAGLLLYFSGNLANDWFDRKWDEERRPERALPSGLFKPGSYLAGALSCAAAGTALAFFQGAACGICALGILAFISIYTRFHKVAIWSVLPMGLCRAGLYFLGATAFWSKAEAIGDAGYDPAKFLAGALLTLAIPASGLLSYIAGLSLSARYEGMSDAPPGPRVVSKAMLIIPLIAMSCLFVADAGSPWIRVLGMAPFAVWLALCFTHFAKPIPRYVSALLAGIPLVDLIAMAPLAWWAGKPWLAALPFGAFVLGRALQKLAPAT
ncbi:UbiA family prenyltransferase [Luteolibacter luteus]|uniref:UbiA family prenyltransferase n=1 Tax=Luteolibacter luteus TaxID=2728835 RepID=A0A858RF93_9BACT|nr:UbiA family prenyltransferase [Luteolibacter luteus]QJE94970.1 UbiA family prenyltransferase [Luteolibacter luteus]